MRWLARNGFGCGLVVCLMLASGCGQSAEMKKMGFQGPPPAVPNSEVIAKFMGREGMTVLYMNFDEVGKSTSGTRAAVVQPQFLEMFAVFKEDPLPDGFVSDQRAQDKEEFVQALEALIEGAKKKVSDQEFRELVEPVRPAAEAFMRPTNY